MYTNMTFMYSFKYSLQAEHMFERLQTVGVVWIGLNVHSYCCDNQQKVERELSMRGLFLKH